MSKIKYVIGDATQPIGDKNELRIITHICNDVGAWGSGFVLAISKRWKQPEKVYRAMSKYILGTVKTISVDHNLAIANMIAQHNTGLDTSGNPPIRYDALKSALTSLNRFAILNSATIHMPRIGAGLAGGDWKIIETIIEDTITTEVYVYDLPSNQPLNNKFKLSDFDKIKLPLEINIVKLLGEEMGYGHLIHLAAAMWRRNDNTNVQPLIPVKLDDVQPEFIDELSHVIEHYDEITKTYEKKF